MKIAIVTGASSGLGREFVKQISHLYQSLDEVWVIARRRDRLEALKSVSRFPLRIQEGDLLKTDIYETLKEALNKEQPDIRMLVNAAGFGKSGTIEEIAQKEENAQREMIDVNCRALTEITLLCLPYITQGSRIINIASAAAFCPQPYFAVYAATKSYVLSFSRALGAELRKRGASVTAVCPGPVDTEFFKVSGGIGHNLLKQLTMVRPEPVVKKALLDARSRKGISVYGIPMKTAHAASKLLPNSLIVRLEAMF